MKRLLKVASSGLLAVLVGATGCADPDEIDRVQPDLIEKSSLAGEWHTLSTVTRSPFASHWVFPGLQGTLERGVWEIERDFAYFYRTYEFVQGSEQRGIRGDTDTPLLDEDGDEVTYEITLPDGTVKSVVRYVYRSSPLYRFPVLGHYDVRRKYNPLTGQESNVVVEDSSEKFWFERDFVRVDFGVNTAQNFGGMEFGPGAATIYEGEEGAPETRLRVGDDGDYLDYTVRGFVEAPRSYLAGWGWVPTCLFFPWYTGSYFECDEEEIWVRSAFKKLPQDNSYEPLVHNDHMLNKFGYYRSARAAHDREFGITFSDAIRHIRRFRIWDEYVVGDDGRLDYSQMEPEPIVYYVSEEFPRELVRGARDLADQWNASFMQVVQERKGGAYDGRMFVLCENNTAEVEALVADNPDVELLSTDPEYCEDMDQAKVLGDLRYHMLVSVNDPVQYGLYGYGPMHSDPVTGETIHANAFQYTGNLRRGARRAVDMIEYAAGVQSFRDVTQARHIDTQLYAEQLEATEGDPRGGVGAEAAVHLASMAISPDVHTSMSGPDALSVVDTDIASARMNRLLGADDFDQHWMNADMASAVGLPVEQLDRPLDNALLSDIVHPAHIASERVMRKEFDFDVQRGTQAICMGDRFDDSIRGLALELKDTYDAAMCEGLKDQMDDGAELAFDFDAFREPGADCTDSPSVCGEGEQCTPFDQGGGVSASYCITPCSAGALLDQLRGEIRRVNQISQFVYWDPNALYTPTDDARVLASQQAAREIIESKRDEVFWDIFDRMWSTVAMHEVGHNVGLRHNFASSTDALNYFQDFWDFKGREVGGEWEPYVLFDTDTESQVVNRMREYQQTSIMEYSGSFNARFQGLGTYDQAAIMYGYGELVQVFEAPPTVSDWEALLADPSDTDPDEFTLQQRREAPLARALRNMHYTNYPDLFGGVDNIYERRWVDAYEVLDTSRPCSQHDDPYDPSVCGGGSFCTPGPDGFYCSQADMLEVPYRFCSDEYNWSQTDCQTWDEGADPYEIVRNAIADYEAYWPFRAYKRDNDLFSPNTTYWNQAVMFQYGLRKHFEHWAYEYARYNRNDWWEDRHGTPWHEDPNGGLGQTLAAMEMFEYLANIFGRPSDAYYAYNVDRAIYEPIVDNGRNDYCNVFQVREDVGARPIYPSYDFDGYLYTPHRAGTFYDRLAAFIFMSYPYSMFTVGVDKAYDIRRFRVNFASAWPQRMHNLFAGLLMSDPSQYGWCVEHDDPTIDVSSCTSSPQSVKKRLWFGDPAELDAHYANCEPLNPEPEYDFPTTQYRLPALAAMYGFGFMSYTFDRSFIDRSRLWLQGDGSDVTIPPGFETVEYTDPFSGKTYVASYDPTEEDPFADATARDSIPSSDPFNPDPHLYWPAARMVAHANQLLDEYDGNLALLSAEYELSPLQQTVGRLEVVRGLYRHFDFGF